MERPLEVVNRFYDATENKKGKGLETILAKDMRFDGPRMLKQFESGSDVCSIYEMDIATPAGGTITIELTDWIRVANGKVAKQKIYYDPREFAKAFGMT
jgi:ketosteroid isomerase-like protein